MMLTVRPCGKASCAGCAESGPTSPLPYSRQRCHRTLVRRRGDERTMNPLPAPIAVPWAEYQAEPRPFQKLHRLVDTYEALLKYATVLAVQNFYAAGMAAEHPDVDRMIREQIGRPLLGQWTGF